MNAPQCYGIRTLPVLLCINLHWYLYFSTFLISRPTSVLVWLGM